VPQAAAEAILATHPALLEAALDAAIAAFGSVEALAADGLGLDARRLAALRDALLE